ncbi:piggyBac transposable element-derived protein 4-like [Onthophagus taurus]|uniref:piggyBac transposable element-derived protein 4-like n=1 Tax=Onthophagus taurus TaxID=166361 RepID=UPI0039BDCB94
MSGLETKRRKKSVKIATSVESDLFENELEITSNSDSSDVEWVLSESEQQIASNSDSSDVAWVLSQNEQEIASNSDSSDVEENPIIQNITDFLWENKSADYEPTFFPLLTNSGICDGILEENPTEYDCFVASIQPKFITHITSKTNNFHTFIVNTKTSEENSKIHKWVTTDNEVYVFLAITMLFTHMNKNEWKDYWSTDLLIGTPIFGKIMSQDRFSLLLRMLHFSDNNELHVGDKLQKIRPIIELLRSRFKASMKPFKDLCIDESIVPWKGRLSFKQYIPSKRHRFGIKLFVLCDVETGFILDFIVYTGSSTEINNIAGLGISGSITTTLLEPHLDKGHTIYYDNWYSSPHLSSYLLMRNTGSCGTIKYNRKGMPKNFPNKMKKGEIEMRNTKKMMVIKWHDKRDILTTVHKNEIKDTGK